MMDHKTTGEDAMDKLQIVLASTSQYRKKLLERLGIPFCVANPAVEETPLPEESAADLVQRLALAKAKAVQDRYPEALIIGADQVAVRDGLILGKPGTFPANVAQLAAVSGRRVEFLTGLCLVNAKRKRVQVEVVPFAVVFRPLRTPQIEGYVRREQPFDCAGGFKSEGLGIALFARMEGEDPTALIGLPLIALVRMLEQEGVDVLGGYLG
jgi:septum formation protein